MRKLVVFLLLLGAGLVLLYWLDRHAGPPPQPAPEPPPPPSAVEPAEEAQGLTTSGPVQFTQFDRKEGRRVVAGRSEDSRAEAGVDVLDRLVLELYDPTPPPPGTRAPEETPEVVLRAVTARARRAPGAERLEPSWERALELEDVEIEAVSGLPLAPLTFRAARASVELPEDGPRVVRSDAPFTATSAELEIAGEGVLLELDAERLEIPRGGRVELRREGAPPATFTARGAGRLVVRRPEGPAGPVLLEASDGAVLELGGDDPGRLEADHLVLRASPGADGELALEGLTADGSVTWTASEPELAAGTWRVELFAGETLVAGFTPDGRLEQARLEGRPRAELALDELDPGLLPAVDTGGAQRVELNARDFIEVDWDAEGFRISLEGLPADGIPSVRTQDFELWSARRIEGRVSEGSRSARFQAEGGVEIRSGPAQLETASFTVEIAPDASGQTVLTGTASGGARLEGALPTEEGVEPRTFTLASPDGLTIERSARGWRVIEGTRVAVALDSPQGFRARADRVEELVVPESESGELDPEGLRLTASGAVVVELERGRVGGEELSVLAVEPVPHIVVRGTAESKAYYSGDLGEASALEVELTGGTIHARGEVTGSAQLVEGTEVVRVRFAGDDLVYDRLESEELLPGEVLRTQRVRVEGNVSGSVAAGEETLVARCQRFSAEHRTRLVEGEEPLELGSLFIAEGDVHANLLDADGELVLDCERFEVDRTASDLEAGFRQALASGDVRFQLRTGGRDELDLAGDCELLVIDANRHGSLEADPFGRVTLVGRDPERGTPYRMTADRVDFEFSESDELRVLALDPELRMVGVRARAQHFTADETAGLVLTGGVRMTGATSAQVPFTLDADEVTLAGRRIPEAAGAERAEQLDSLAARGKVDFRLSDRLRARGDRLSLRRTSGLLRLDGSPATFELASMRIETEWVEFDPVLEMLVATGSGRMIPLPEVEGAMAPRAPATTVPASFRVPGASLAAPAQAPPAQTAEDEWRLEFLSASTLLELDSVVLVIQEPVVRTAQFQAALRASWAILWFNREAFQDSELRDDLLASLQRSVDRMRELPEKSFPSILSMFRSAELAGLLREVYFEGPVEVLGDGELLARADAIYLDTASQHGWLARATVNLGGQFMGQRQEKLIVKTDWLRLSSDGSLRADRATVTSCTFDEPHVSVVTGDLRIEPVGVGDAHFQLRMEDNRVELYDKLRIPLPTIDVATDEEFTPLLPTLSLANSARFGTLFSFAMTRPADNIGRAFDSIARPDGGGTAGEVPALPEGEPGTPVPLGDEAVPPSGVTEVPPPPPSRKEVDAHYKIDGSYLGSRGGLLDLGIEIEAEPDYFFDLYLGVALDDGEDRGFIRVPEDDRSELRRWLRSRAYFDNEKNDWAFSYTDQSDAAVQSEFYEGQFLRYERAETYLQWLRHDEEWFVQGSAEVRTDDFRSEVEELPSFSGYRGRTPLVTFGDVALVHTGDARAEYLRRRIGTGPRSPFEPLSTFGDDVGTGFGDVDGFGEREVLRADTTQTLELPLALGSGWKLTPFVSGTATAWSEGEVEEDSPTRMFAEAGARLATTLWKRGRRGTLHQIAPFVEYRTELAREDEDGTPVVYDELDRVVTGDFLRLGTRARFGTTPLGSVLDLDLVGTYASSRSDDRPDGWLPVEMFGRLVLEPRGHEIEIFYDGRLDPEERRTVYSLVSFGTHLGERWGVQFSHQRGLDTDYRPLFEAASVAGLYRWTEKWEFEARESFSLLEDEELDTKIVLRRYGHDIVFELESSVREGEGSSVGISVRPRFGYRPPRIGYVPW